jgi:hypothetical protein
MAEIIDIDSFGGLQSTKRLNNLNEAQGRCSTTFGGGKNQILFTAPLNNLSVQSSTIIGGGKNIINSPSCFSTIFGGQLNCIKQTNGSIGGGCNNTIQNETGVGSIIGGGHTNLIQGNYSSIGGGDLNCTDISEYSTVFGGKHNMGFANNTTNIGGWYNWNFKTANHSTISGGYDNCTLQPFSTIGGGLGNTSNSAYSLIGGGRDNNTKSLGITSTGSTIFGGRNNVTYCKYSTILGGSYNEVRENSTVGGGFCNRVTGVGSLIGGGKENLILSSNYDTILGGTNNRICNTTNFQSSGSTILGGTNNVIENSSDSGIVGSNNYANAVNGFVLSTDSIVYGFYNAVLGGQNLQSFINDDTVYVPFLNIRDLGPTPFIFNLGIDAQGYVVPGTDPNSPNLIAARGFEAPIYPIINNAPTLPYSNIFEGTVMTNAQAYDDWEASGIADTYNPATGIWTCPETALYNISYNVELTQCSELLPGINQQKFSGYFIPPTTVPCSDTGLGWGIDNPTTLTGFTCVCPPGYELTSDGQACVQINILPYTGSPGIPISISPGSDQAWGSFGVRIFKPNSWDAIGFPLSGTTPFNANAQYNNAIPSGGTSSNPSWIHNFCTPNEGNYPNGCSYDYYVFCGWQGPSGGFLTNYTNSNGQLVNYTSQCATGQPANFWRNRMNLINVWKLGNPIWEGTICLCDTIIVPVSKVYYIGIGGDNDFSIEINGTPFVAYVGEEEAWQSNFKWWNIYPVFLNAGPNTIYMCNENLGAAGGLACEIYDMTLTQLTAATSNNDLVTIYSSKEYHQGGTRQGMTSCPTIGCPSGYEYSETDEGPICIEINYTSCTLTITSTTISDTTLGMISAGITDPSNTILYVGNHTTPFQYQKEAHLSGGQVNVFLNQGDQLCLRVNNTTGVPYVYNNGTQDYTSMTIQRVKGVPPSATPTPTPTPTPTITPTPTVTPTMTPSPSCGVSGLTFYPDQLPTPTPTASPNPYQFGCVGLYGDAITDEYFYFAGVRNGKPSFSSNTINLGSINICGQTSYPPMLLYWDNGSSSWYAQSSNGTVCAQLIGSPNPNFPIATGSTDWTSVSTAPGCPCAQFFTLANTLGANPCVYRFRLASASTYTELSQICGSQYFFVGGLQYPYGYTANIFGSSSVNTVTVGTSWYSDITLTTQLSNGFYMLPTIINAVNYTRYWFEIQGGVVVNSGLC